MKCGNGIPAPARVSYIWRVRLGTRSLLPPEMAKNTPSETRASRIENCSHERFPSSTDWINGWNFMALVSPQARPWCQTGLNPLTYSLSESIAEERQSGYKGEENGSRVLRLGCVVHSIVALWYHRCHVGLV